MELKGIDARFPSFFEAIVLAQAHPRRRQALILADVEGVPREFTPTRTLTQTGLRIPK